MGNPSEAIQLCCRKHQADLRECHRKDTSRLTNSRFLGYWRGSAATASIAIFATSARATSTDSFGAATSTTCTIRCAAETSAWTSRSTTTPAIKCRNCTSTTTTITTPVISSTRSTRAPCTIRRCSSPDPWDVITTITSAAFGDGNFACTIGTSTPAAMDCRNCPSAVGTCSTSASDPWNCSSSLGPSTIAAVGRATCPHSTSTTCSSWITIPATCSDISHGPSSTISTTWSRELGNTAVRTNGSFRRWWFCRRSCWW
mmetsp:Transcript_66975/g.105993  ORF Transcript_66975/g.105993 Transcript_66975/m.105993 type:complete len:258 (+) Transcript_66975:1904-2677(+)